MGESNKSLRIRTNVGEDNVVNVNLQQNFDLLEILSLNINQNSAYNLQVSKYGVLVGRVLANGGFGIPNAKVSVFIQIDDNETNDPIKAALYPYNNTSSKNADGVKYNLLPNYYINECYQPVGTFNKKEYILDNNDILEVYDKYYKFTTRTNNSGDYMIFGLPTGNQTIHVDLDLSDIGFLSQRPIDLIYKGYNINQFENPNQFKIDTNLDYLPQIYSQDNSVNIYPYWGDSSDETIAITRHDIQIQYKFEPTCVFMGSVVSDSPSNAISKKCKPSENMGVMGELTTGNGIIEMIRKTPQNTVEEFQIQGNQLINGNGVWCYQIPMNLDYVTTDEYGNMVPTDDPNKGIPTRTKVRFRVGMQDFDNISNNSVRSQFLVPHNPQTESDVDYIFGSLTNDKSYRDLFWNNVYTVKSYIPRFQKGNWNSTSKFTGFKQVNHNGSLNPIPYNNLRIKMSFMFIIMCALIKAYLFMIDIYNWFIGKMAGFSIWKKEDRVCMYIGDGLCPDLEGWYFSPNCGEYTPDGGTGDAQRGNTMYAIIKENSGGPKNTKDPKSIDTSNADYTDNTCLSIKVDYFIQCFEMNLAKEYKVIQFDFYNDWINGLIYLPRWVREIRSKRSFLWGLFEVKEKIKGCTVSNFRNNRDYTQQCALDYSWDSSSSTFTNVQTENGCDENKENCHKNGGRKQYSIFGDNGGVINDTTINSDGIDIYYFKPCEFNNQKRIPLFATDIVLIGSLNNCDLNGIPQAFKDLTSSSYQMPSNLAVTNLDSDGFMYGFNNTNTLCTNYSGHRFPQNSNGTLNLGVDLVNQDLTTQRQALEGTESAVNNFNQVLSDKVAFTEMSGIDWGYIGPGQDTYKGGKRGNDLNGLYFPGGHFLGISCTNSETNIKSCVNLSRACEAGVWLSQRQERLKSVYNNGDVINSYQYNALSPNGLISKDELSDGDFRTMFATMNSNGLKTKINEETGYPIYSFKYINSNINFSGELNNKLGTYYQDTILENYSLDSSSNPSVTYSEYRRVIEDKSVEYYKFRFGLSDDYDFDNAMGRYLNSNEYVNGLRVVSLPVYENSFYFYFGLKDGDSAIDEFNKQYFSNCVSDITNKPSISIETQNESLCGNSDGLVKVTINDMISPYDYQLLRNGTVYREGMGIADNIITIDKLNDGEYELIIQDVNLLSLGKNFKIGKNGYTVDLGIESFNKDITYDYSTYNQAIGRIDEVGGYIYFNGQVVLDGNTQVVGEMNAPGIIIINRDTLSYIYKGYNAISSDVYNRVLGDNYTELTYRVKDGNKIYLWETNVSYEVYIVYNCSNRSSAYNVEQFITSFYANGPLSLTFNIGSSRLNYKRDFRPYIFNNQTPWWFHDTINNLFSDNVKQWLLKKVIFKEDINKNSGININVNGGSSPYVIDLIGQGEYENEEGDIVLKYQTVPENSLDIGNDYNLSLNYILTPTDNFKVIDSNGILVDRLKFGVQVSDITGETIPNADDGQLYAYSNWGKHFVLPLIYKPFYYNINVWKRAFNSVIIESSGLMEYYGIGNNLTKINSGALSGVIYNGITDVDMKKSDGSIKLISWVYNNESPEGGLWVGYDGDSVNNNDFYFDSSKNNLINGRVVKFIESGYAPTFSEDNLNNNITITSPSPLSESDIDYDLFNPTKYIENKSCNFYKALRYSINNGQIIIKPDDSNFKVNFAKFFIVKYLNQNGIDEIDNIIENNFIDYNFLKGLGNNPDSNIIVEEIDLTSEYVFDGIGIFSFNIIGVRYVGNDIIDDNLILSDNVLNMYDILKFYPMIKPNEFVLDMILTNISAETEYVSPIQITKPLVNEAQINWGDGIIETLPIGYVSDSNIKHTYINTIQEPKITLKLGGVDEYIFGYASITDSNKNYLKGINTLILIGQENFNDIFNGCINLEYIDGVVSNGVTSMERMFNDCIELVGVRGALNCGNVNSVASIFSGCVKLRDVVSLNYLKTELVLVDNIAMSEDTIHNIVNNVGEAPQSTPLILNEVHRIHYNSLSDNEKNNFRNKNWEVVFIDV